MDFELVLTHYAIERLLCRVAKSQHVDRLILKGAMLLMTGFDEPFRSTRDLELLVYGDSAPEKRLPPISPKFQSTRPLRARKKNFYSLLPVLFCFNPRTHMGCDLHFRTVKHSNFSQQGNRIIFIQPLRYKHFMLPHTAMENG